MTDTTQPPYQPTDTTQPSINTGGGVGVAGNVNTDGDFVGRDKIVQGNKVIVDKNPGVTVGEAGTINVYNVYSSDASPKQPTVQPIRPIIERQSAFKKLLTVRGQKLLSPRLLSMVLLLISVTFAAYYLEFFKQVSAIIFGPTQTPTINIPFETFVKIDGEQEKSPPIYLSAAAGDLLRIEIVLRDQAGELLSPDLGVYLWSFDPEDPINAQQVDTGNHILLYTVPKDDRRMIKVDVEATGYQETIDIWVTIN